jgi:hypothetical protein
MPTEYESFAGQLVQSEAEAPPPPPPMPEAADPTASTPPPEEPAEATTTAAPVEKPAAQPAEKADGWQVDFYRLRKFNDAVVRARSYLDAVQAKVDRMQGTELTPQLGTSPVGTQLAKKFDDRLNSADGLRVMLTEAMKRMDDFVASAEKAARAYEENEEDSVVTFTASSPEPPPAKRG